MDTDFFLGFEVFGAFAPNTSNPYLSVSVPICGKNLQSPGVGGAGVGFQTLGARQDGGLPA